MEDPLYKQNQVPIPEIPEEVKEKLNLMKNKLDKFVKDITKENNAVVNKLKEFAEVKNVDNLNARFCVIDSKNLLFMMHEDDKVHPRYDTGIWVNTPLFAATMEQTFQKL